MAIRDLIPWRRGGSPAPARNRSGDPFLALQEEMNRLLDRFLWGWGPEPFGQLAPFGETFAPSVDISENDKEVRIQAEMPGMDENDIDLSLSDGVLTLQGEKKESREEKDKGRTYTECRYGKFRRDIPLPASVDPDKVDAKYEKGVLTVTMPKTEQAKPKQIPVKT